MKRFPKIVVALNIKKMNAVTLCSKAKGVKTTGDPAIVNPSISDADLYQLADDILSIISLRKNHQSKSITRQQNDALNHLKNSYTYLGRDVQIAANKVAEATGSVAAGEAVVVRCGFTLKKKRQMSPRTFEVVSSGDGWIHFRVKSAAKNATYIWRFGLSNQRGVMPTEFMPIMVTMVCELIITHSFTGYFMACQVACVLPKPRSSRSRTARGKLAKNALAAYIGNKPVVEAGIDSLQWSGFVYTMCH